jgi:nucleoside-diphosphate-sugar epimerase
MVPRQATLIGNTGLLGTAIELRIRSFPQPWSAVVAPKHRELISALLQRPEDAPIHRLLKLKVNQDWIFVAGLVDSGAASADLNSINVDAPLRLIDELSRDPDPGRHRLITFGSVLERRPELSMGNAYLNSKARLFETWQRVHSELPLTWIHVQLHTLFGGTKPPHPSMFTGQMLAALTTGSQFKMSGGEQLREYHHVDDIARSVLHFLATHPSASRTLELSCGRPVRLRDLAYRVFEHFHQLDLLSVGAWRASAAEVYHHNYVLSPYLLAHREPCAGVVAWFEELGVQKI